MVAEKGATYPLAVVDRHLDALRLAVTLIIALNVRCWEAITKYYTGVRMAAEATLNEEMRKHGFCLTQATKYGGESGRAACVWRGSS